MLNTRKIWMKNRRSKRKQRLSAMSFRRCSLTEPRDLRDLRRFALSCVCELFDNLCLQSDDNAEEEEATAVSNKSPKQSKIQAINSHINNTSPAEIIRTKPSQNQAIKSPQRRSSPPKSSPTSTALGSSENLESEFTRVFNQMRRDKQELVV